MAAIGSFHLVDLVVVGIVLETAIIGAKRGFFWGVVFGMKALAAGLLAIALSGRVASWAVSAEPASTTSLGIAFLAILAATGAALHLATNRLIGGREVALPSRIDTVGGGLAGVLGGFFVAGTLLVAVSMFPIRDMLRIGPAGIALDAGVPLLRVFARCLELAPASRELLLDSYRSADWMVRPQADDEAPPADLPEDVSSASEQMADAAGGVGTFAGGTLPMEDLSHWRVESGDWTIVSVAKEGRSKKSRSFRIRGRGDSRLSFRHPIPRDMTLRLKMRIRSGTMRPAVCLTGPEIDLRLGNEGVGHTLTLQGDISSRQETTRMRYSFDQTHDIRLTITGRRATLAIDGQEISSAMLADTPEKTPEADPTPNASDGVWFTLSAGNALSPGEAEFWDIRVTRPIPEKNTHFQ